LKCPASWKLFKSKFKLFKFSESSPNNKQYQMYQPRAPWALIYFLFVCQIGAQGYHVIPKTFINILNQYMYILNIY